jgi:hypothetical protein
MTMFHEDRPMAEIQRTIDSKRGRKRRGRTPTAKPPMEEKH